MFSFLDKAIQAEVKYFDEILFLNYTFASNSKIGNNPIKYMSD